MTDQLPKNSSGYRTTHTCELCGFEPKTKNKYREKQDHLVMKHFKSKIDKIFPHCRPYKCPANDCPFTGKDKQALLRHYTGKHGVLELFLKEALEGMGIPYQLSDSAKRKSQGHDAMRRSKDRAKVAVIRSTTAQADSTVSFPGEFSAQSVATMTPSTLMPITICSVSTTINSSLPGSTATAVANSLPIVSYTTSSIAPASPTMTHQVSVKKDGHFGATAHQNSADGRLIVTNGSDPNLIPRLAVNQGDLLKLLRPEANNQSAGFHQGTAAGPQAYSPNHPGIMYSVSDSGLVAAENMTDVTIPEVRDSEVRYSYELATTGDFPEITYNGSVTKLPTSPTKKLPSMATVLKSRAKCDVNALIANFQEPVNCQVPILTAFEPVPQQHLSMMENYPDNMPSPPLGGQDQQVHRLSPHLAGAEQSLPVSSPHNSASSTPDHIMDSSPCVTSTTPDFYLPSAIDETSKVLLNDNIMWGGGVHVIQSQPLHLQQIQDGALVMSGDGNSSINLPSVHYLDQVDPYVNSLITSAELDLEYLCSGQQAGPVEPGMQMLHDNGVAERSLNFGMI